MARQATTEAGAGNGGAGEEAWETALADTLRAGARRAAPGGMCPPPEDLVRLAGLPPGARAGDPLYAGHVALCGWCRGQVEALAAGLEEPDADPSPAASGAGGTAPERWPFRWFAFPAAGATAALATAVLMYVFAVAPAREAARRQADALAAANARLKAAARVAAVLPSPVASATPAPPRLRPTPGAARIAVVTPTPAPRPRPVVTPRAVPTGPIRVASAAGDAGAVHVPDLSALATRQIVVRGGDTPKPRVTLLTPVGTRVVSARPTLSWQPFPGARGYKVLIADGEDNPVAESGTLGSDVTAWTPPRDLHRGTVLFWEVHALDDTEHDLAVSAEGPFGIVTEAQATALGSAAAAYGAASLARAVALLNAGALADAEAVLTPLAADPSLTEVQRARAARLLGEARAARRAIGGEDDHKSDSSAADGAKGAVPE